MTSLRTTTTRTAIRRFVYAGLLALTTLSLASAPASAQESAHGHFTLPHSVLWEKAVVPAGDYEFSYIAQGPTGELMLSKLDAPHAGFMFMVIDTDESAPSGTSRLLLHGISTQSYVTAMTLPVAGVTLHFSTPPQIAEKEIARASNGSLTSGR